MNITPPQNFKPTLEELLRLVVDKLCVVETELQELKNNRIRDKTENIELKRQIKELHQLHFNTPIAEPKLSDKELRIKQLEAKFEAAELKKITKQKKHP